MTTFLDFEPSALSPCRGLRELELYWAPIDFLRDRELQCISAIKSTEMERIIINRCYGVHGQEVTWPQLDDILTEIAAGKLGHDGRLEVEFRLNQNLRDYQKREMRSYDQQISLPKFVKKGRVTTWDPEGNLVCCSDADKTFARGVDT